MATNPAVSGSYTGRHPLGLFWSMVPIPRSSGIGYRWATGGDHFHVALSTGGRRWTGYLRRRYLAAGVSTQSLTLARDGFDGTYFAPYSSRPEPAILAFGGSEGGLPSEPAAALFADHGYPTLDIGYFNLPGLPKVLANIPLEYFAKALRWLAAQPGVDPHRIWVKGVSRGSEAAQLLGLNYPDLVHGVIALVPSNSAVCSYPGCGGPAWLFHGSPVPFTSEFSNPDPADNPAAVFRDERFDGPLLLDCGGVDGVWTSCLMANAIMSRLSRDRWPHELLSYPHAGHGIGSLAVGWPGVEGSATVGDTALANAMAEEDQWPNVLAFVAAN